MTDWINASDPEAKVLEQKKAKFRKMEKWNAVKSFRKASRKK